MATKPIIKPTAPNASAIVATERARIAAIMKSPEGRQRPEQALMLAVETAMPADQCISMLKTMPVANPYLAAMEREGNLNIPALGTMGAQTVVPGDPRAARMEDIKGAARAVNAANGRGYRLKGERLPVPPGAPGLE